MGLLTALQPLPELFAYAGTKEAKGAAKTTIIQHCSSDGSIIDQVSFILDYRYRGNRGDSASLRSESARNGRFDRKRTGE